MSTPRKHLQPLAALTAVTLGLMLAATVVPAAALAGTPSPTAGVHIDPSSPEAKEYALPLATARGAPADSGSKGALFGSGISANKSKGNGQDEGGTGGDRRSTSNPYSGTTENPTTTAESATPAPTATQTATATVTQPAPVTAPPPAVVHQTITSSTPAVTHTIATHSVIHPGRHRRRHAPRPVTKPTLTPGPANTQIVTGAKATGAPAAFKVLHPSSGSSWLWMLLAAVLVLGLGGGGALLLSRGGYRGSGPSPN
jgi:hypothetical protein